MQGRRRSPAPRRLHPPTRSGRPRATQAATTQLRTRACCARGRPRSPGEHVAGACGGQRSPGVVQCDAPPPGVAMTVAGPSATRSLPDGEPARSDAIKPDRLPASRTITIGGEHGGVPNVFRRSGSRLPFVGCSVHRHRAPAARGLGDQRTRLGIADRTEPGRRQRSKARDWRAPRRQRESAPSGVVGSARTPR
jgi:hypothetical protein